MHVHLYLAQGLSIFVNTYLNTQGGRRADTLRGRLNPLLCRCFYFVFYAMSFA